MNFNEKLTKMLVNAYQNVPYYRDLFDSQGIDVKKINNYENFQKIPLLDKRHIRREPQNFVNLRHKKDNLDCFYTSGSTGIMLPIYWSKEDEIKSELFLQRERKKIGYNIKELSCNFTVKYLDVKCEAIFENIKFDNIKKRIYFDASKLSDVNCRNYYELIVNYSPKVIYGTPSILFVFATYIYENNLPCIYCVNFIELYGEFLPEAYRVRISKIFKNAQIINQYGCREVGAIAIEHAQNKMYCITNNVYVEILKNGKPVDDGNEGEVYISSLTNSSMPVIRYRIGDIGCINEEKNEFGEFVQRLTIKAGRECEPIVLNDQTTANSSIFWLVVCDINKIIGNKILQFNVIQIDYDRLLVNLVLDNNSNKKRVEFLFCEYLKKYIGEFLNIEFVFYDKLKPSDKSGKLKYFMKTFNEN